jgi:ATP-dependent DNA helicase RecQ
MVYSLADVAAMRRMIERSEGGETFRGLQQRKLNALLGYGETVECRRKVLLEYFGESHGASCGNCDNCNDPQDTWDGTTAAQMALSCVYRTGQRFGAVHLADVLTGNASDRVTSLGHDRIRTFGVGSHLSKSQWQSVFRQLLAAGLLTVDLSVISGFRLTESSWPVLKGDRTVRFRTDPARTTATHAARQAKPRPADFSDADDIRLWETLRRLRMDIARDEGLPPFVVFHDRTLREMVANRPISREGLLRIPGVGERKADRYGDAFLKAIQASTDA